MKNFYSLLILFFFCKTYANEAIIFNMSERNDMTVFYKSCYYKDTIRKCGLMKNIIIKNKSFVKFKPDSEINTVVVISTEEKDRYGNILAKGGYWYNDGISSSCYAGMDNISNYLGIIILNDMNESPYILCNYAQQIRYDN